MQPIILSNAFVRTCNSHTKAYACVEEMVGVIRDNLGSSPLLLPTAFDPESMAMLLDHVDGIFLPGAVSNIHPSAYGDVVKLEPQPFDPAHDATDLFLIRQARTRGIPFFGICRSMQAMNVAFGGTLHQKLPPSAIDHYCSDPCDGRDETPAFMHEVEIEGGGLLARLFPTPKLWVNSIHKQGVDRLGEGLRVEARALDGVIEAISWPEAPSFFAAFQWHPEAMPQNTVSKTLFSQFKQAVHERFESHGDE